MGRLTSQFSTDRFSFLPHRKTSFPVRQKTKTVTRKQTGQPNYLVVGLNLLVSRDFLLAIFSLLPSLFLSQANRPKISKHLFLLIIITKGNKKQSKFSHVLLLCRRKTGGSDNELALVSKQQNRFVDLNVGDLLSELLGIYSRDLKKSFKYNRPLRLCLCCRFVLQRML